MTTKKRKTEKVTFRLTQDQKDMLKRAAARLGKDEGQFVRDVVLQECGRMATEAA